MAQAVMAEEQGDMEFLGFIVRLAIGAGAFLALMLGALYMISLFWRDVAEVYAGKPASLRIARKFPETIVITARIENGGSARGSPGGQKGWHVYPAARIDVHEQGLVVAMIPPFNFLCPPLFLPFAELDMQESWWPSLPEPVALRMRRVPHIDILIRGPAARWVRELMRGHGVQPSLAR